jgi:hypothetical protein
LIFCCYLSKHLFAAFCYRANKHGTAMPRRPSSVPYMTTLRVSSEK